MTDTPPANPVFNTAGGSLSPAAETQAVIVDVQLGCVKFMGREDARNYLTHLGETIEDMRSRKIPIPVNWVVIGREDTLYPPSRDATSEPYTDDELADIGFFQLDPRRAGNNIEENQDIFEEFINDHGPRRNETILTKRNFNAFENDLLADHLVAGGTKNILTMGLVGSVCALETAIGGVQRGFNTNLLLDNVACWGGPRERYDEIAPLVWRDGYSSPDEAHRWHRSEMAAALVKKSREFTDADRQAAARINYTTYNDFTSSAPTNAPPPNSPPTPRPL